MPRERSECIGYSSRISDRAEGCPPTLNEKRYPSMDTHSSLLIMPTGYIHPTQKHSIPFPPCPDYGSMSKNHNKDDT